MRVEVGVRQGRVHICCGGTEVKMNMPDLKYECPIHFTANPLFANKHQRFFTASRGVNRGKEEAVPPVRGELAYYLSSINIAHYKSASSPLARYV